MPIKNLEKALRSFYKRYTAPSKTTKSRLKEDAMASFRAAQNRQTLHRWVFMRRASFSMVMVFGIAVLGVITSSVTPSRVKAGTIQAQYGPVEIIRGEHSFLVRDESDIFVGDLVRVGNRGIAKLDMKNQAISTITEKTHLRVTDIDALFIEKGRLASEAFKGIEVATDRGLIRTTPGAIVSFEVSETGQTTVSPEKNLVEVFDLQNGQALLGQGESLTLHSDTQLSDITRLPENQTMSSAQIEALQSKLAIARSKLLSAIEKQAQGKRLLAQEDFLSAENTFKSLTQVLLSSRELEIARRKNLEDTTIAEVYPQLTTRVDHSGILQEAESLALALYHFQNLETPLTVKYTENGDSNLNRYLLLKKIAETQTGKTQIAFEDLATRYVVNFLSPIQNEPLLADQVILLEEKITAMTDNADTYYFLRRVANKMSPDLAAAMEVQINAHF